MRSTSNIVARELEGIPRTVMMMAMRTMMMRKRWEYSFEI
jgi:hypothetical protein